MKKICFVVYDMSIRGGVEQVTINLVNEFVKTYEVHVLGLCETEKIACEFNPKIHYYALRKQELRLREMQKRLLPYIKTYFKENQIDVAIIQGNYPGFITAFARFGCKTKLVFCDHGALMNQWVQKDIVFIRFLASVLCHKVVTLTEQSRNDYIRKFHLPSRKVQCIYNWIDLEVPRSECYRSDSKKIISAGRFGKEKGFDMLIKAFEPVAKSHPDWELDIYGDGEMMPVLEELICTLHLENNVHLLGMQKDLVHRYKEYSMYVLPSYREGLPLVLLEAKANRLPIISFDIMTGPRDIVRDGIDGFLIEPYDIEKIGSAMCQLIEDEKLRCRMSERSQENLSKFSKDKILQDWQYMIDRF